MLDRIDIYKPYHDRLHKEENTTCGYWCPFYEPPVTHGFWNHIKKWSASALAAVLCWFPLAVCVYLFYRWIH